MARTKTRRSPRLGRLVAIGATAALASAAFVTPCAARTISLSETGRLQLTSKHNFTLNERGSATGTIAGQIFVHLTAVSSTRVTVEVNIYPHGGSISGHGSGAYRRSGSTARFSGAMSFGHGSGRYASARGTNLSFSGTIDEAHGDAITVYVSGAVSS